MFRGSGSKRTMKAGASYNAPHKGGRRPKVPRQVTTATKRPQRARGRK